MSNVMNDLDSDIPVEMIENMEEVDTVGEDVSFWLNSDLSCMWPPATRRAFSLRKIPFESLFSFRKQLMRIIFFLCVSDSPSLRTPVNTFLASSPSISFLMAFMPCYSNKIHYGSSK